jgi:hypothetical protein
MSWKLVGAAAMALAVAACGTDSRDRTTGGAAAGAATGAGIGAFGGPVGALAGAAIGGGAGAVTGATTSPRDVNLGTPPWSNPEVRTPMDERHRRSASGTRPARETAAARRERQAEQDRAYMGGGMVGTPTGTGASMAPAPSASGGPGTTSTGTTTTGAGGTTTTGTGGTTAPGSSAPSAPR